MANKTNTYFGFSMMILVAVAALNIAIATLICGVLSKAAPIDMSAKATAARIAPVGMLNTGAAIAAPAPVAAAASVVAASVASAAARSGEDVYNATCVSCHGTGAAGAPKLGDAAAWAPRIAKGTDALVQSAIKGVPGTSMMPKGMCADCSNDDLKATVAYMTSMSQ